MCGIVGFVDCSRQRSGSDLTTIVREMADRVSHRGPDDSGTWVDPRVGIALGHRRLSILDLSALGHQPMVSADGRAVVVFNGEIYNFAALRRALEPTGYPFQSDSDTEVLLAGIREWGFDATLSRCVGMFAIAAWDVAEQTLWLGRDRMGEKPLYYGWQGRTFMFCSDLASLRVHPNWDGDVDRDAIALLMRYGYIPAPHSIWRDIRKLPAARSLKVDVARLVPRQWPSHGEYWASRERAEILSRELFAGTEHDAASALDELLREAIGLQMIADVPLGAFLSGGIDSSVVVALMQAQSSRPVKTFTIGFHEEGFNEAEHAKAVATHLGTDHTELYVTPDEAMGIIPSLADVYTEPFADSSQIPTCLVSRLARRDVTVSLSGDGGDELFCGYTRYQAAARIARVRGWIPPAGRMALGAILTDASPRLLNLALRLHDRSLGKPVTQARSRHEWSAIAGMLHEPEELFYRGFLTHWPNPAALVNGSREPSHAAVDPAQWARLPEPMRRLMYADTISYLPDDILVKVDRAAMAVSLETRAPLLDHRVVEFAWGLPLNMLYRQGQSKWLLRQVLYRYVPRELVERPKMGFGVPIDTWLRGPLRDWAETLLSERRLRSDSYFDPLAVRDTWAEHLSGSANRQYPLWNVLMFQSWLDASRCATRAPSSEVVCS